MGTMTLLIQTALFIGVLAIIIMAILLALTQFSPFKDCEKQDYKGTIEFKGKTINCYELLAVNTTSGGNNG